MCTNINDASDVAWIRVDEIVVFDGLAHSHLQWDDAANKASFRTHISDDTGGKQQFDDINIMNTALVKQNFKGYFL